MTEFLNSEVATLLVNLIVILGLLLFLFFGVKKFLPSLAGEKLKQQVQTSTTSQNVFAFVSVVVASTLLDLLSNEKYDMLWIVLVVSILTIIFSFLYDKVANKNQLLQEQEEYKRSLNLIEQIIGCKGYGLIKNAKEIENIENDSDEIYIFTEDLITDIHRDYLNLDEGSECSNIGLFASIVAQNIPNGKKYIYFLKDTLKNREYQKAYFEYHFKNKNLNFKKKISFYFIAERDFCFI